MIYVIGRGRTDVKGNINIPLNKKIVIQNLIFIDLNETSNPDYNLDFIEMEYNNKVKNIFLFDWSTFYCSSIKNINKLLQKIDNFVIYVPMDLDEFKICDELLLNKYFISNLVKNKYPLYDWNSKITQKYINPNYFIKIKPK